MKPSTTTKPATIADVQRVASDLGSLTQSVLSDLETLFIAIRDASDEYRKEHGLAGIGQYLATDWADMLDSSMSELQAALADFASEQEAAR